MNIDSAAFNLPATVKAFKGKLKRNDFQRELVHTGLIKKSEIAFERLDKHNDRPKTNAAIAAYNDYLTSCINVTSAKKARNSRSWSTSLLKR